MVKNNIKHKSVTAHDLSDIKLLIGLERLLEGKRFLWWTGSTFWRVAVRKCSFFRLKVKLAAMCNKLKITQL